MASEILRPDGMGNDTDLIGSSAISNRNTLIDDVVVDDTDYVYWAGTSEAIDEYTFANHGRLGTETIESVVVKYRAYSTPAGRSDYDDSRIYIMAPTLGGDYSTAKSYGNSETWIQHGTSVGANTVTFSTDPNGQAWTWATLNALYVGVALKADSGNSSRVTQVYVEVTYSGPFTYGADSFAVEVGTDIPAFTQSIDRPRALTVQVEPAPTVARTGTWNRAFSTAAATSVAIEHERNLGTWLVVASQDSGTIRTRVGSSWAAAAKTGSVANLGGAYLAQFDNRLCVIESTKSGFHYSAVNNLTSNWTSKPKYPNLPVDITDMFAGRDASDNPSLYFLTPQGLYYLDVFENFVFGLTEVQWEHDVSAGKKGLYFRGRHYISVGKGIYEVVGNTVNLIGPDRDDGLPEEISGTITDMIGVGFWLVIALDGGNDKKSVILKRRIDGDHWHVVYKTASAPSRIQALFWDSGTLYFGEGTNVKSLPLPSSTDNVKLLSTYEVAASGSIIYPWFHSQFEAVSKVAHKIRAVTQNMNSSEYADVYYRIDSNTGWTLLGRLESSPRPTALSFTDGTNAVGVEFERIQFKLSLARGGTVTDRPVIESLTLDYRVVPEVIWKWVFKVDAVTTEERKGSEIIDALATAVSSKTLLEFFPTGDKGDTSYFVQVVGIPRAQQGTEFGAEGEYQVTLSMVTE